MLKTSHFVLRHKLWVGLFWLALLVAGAAGSGALPDRLSYDFSFPNTQSDDANHKILEKYGSGATMHPIVPVVVLPAGANVDQPEVRSALAKAFGAANAAVPRSRVAAFPDTSDRAFVSADGRTTFGLVFTPTVYAATVPNHAPAIDAAMRAALPAGTQLHLTGIDQLYLPDDSSGDSPTVLTETLLGGLGALAVLLFVFASLLAFVPLLIAAVAILSTLLVVLGLTTFTDVNFVVQFLAALIGLGVAIDYSLLVITRWREELAHGHKGDEAIHRAMSSAGRAVAFSGITVAIGLIALVILPVPYMRSVGIGGVLIPLISTLVTLTLLPVILSVLGRRLAWPRIRTDNTASRGWTAWAQGVIRYRWVAAGVGLAILGALTLAALGIKLGEPDSDALSATAPPSATAGLTALRDAGIPTGVITPIEVIAPAGTALESLSNVAGVRAVISPADPAWQRGGTELSAVLPNAETSTSAGKDTIERVIDAVPDGVGVGGVSAQVVDGTHALYDSFPLVLVVIGLVTFLLLARAFRSLLLPLKAVLLNLISLAASYGIMVLIWQHGYGSELIWDVPATGAITFWIPMMVFAFLYGLSMDYEVFILARMREEYDETGSTRTAIVEGIGRTGRLVTSAALILFLAFMSLATAPNTDIKILATGLGAGILLDATVVRALLVPATVSLFGRWNWWLPVWAARLLRVAPSPATPPAAPAAEPERELVSA